MAKIGTVVNDPELFFIGCPACDSYHPFRIAPPDMAETDPARARFWSWNANFDEPDVTGSLFTNADGSAPVPKCHLFIRKGRIVYLDDCSHELAGVTIDVPDFESFNPFQK